MTANRMTPEQARVANSLAQEYGIDPARVFFPDDKKPNRPWLGADELMTIARKSDRFKSIAERFEAHIVSLDQIVYAARVEDNEGRVFERVGVASRGEKAPDADEAHEHELAKSRALVSALNAAGFNPLKQTSAAPIHPVATFADAAAPASERLTEAQQRNKDLGRIHILAEQAGLITRDKGTINATEYRAWLRENFGIGSSTAADQVTRASIINALERLVIEKGE